MSIPARWASSAEAKKNGWFSRRHETSGPLQQDRMRRDSRKEERKIQGEVRNAEWAAMPNADKLAYLDSLGLEAKRQRAKLQGAKLAS